MLFVMLITAVQIATLNILVGKAAKILYIAYKALIHFN